MKQFTRTAAITFLLVISFLVKAQRTAFYSDQDLLFKQGLELFDKKQYASAQKAFVEYKRVGRSALLKADAAYYAAACGIELFNKDSEWLMRQFIEHNPSSPRLNNAWFYLARSNFRKKKYDETIQYLDKVDLYRLDKDLLAEFYFKRGYSHLQEGKDEKAKSDFHEIREVENKYAPAARYYYSHISYKEKNYEVALSGFNRLTGDETFGAVVPYYITQIYFIQGKYAEVVKNAPGLLSDSANIQKEPEINRMIGESYFHLKDFSNALTYLKKTNVANAAGNYALGYCYYRINDCANAVIYLEKAASGKDSLAQNAWYHMADCYVKLGDKLKARNAFYSAYQLGFDRNINEDALFSFAKLSYELDFSPYNEAVKSFSRYLSEYPQSKHSDEVYNFLINVYSTTKNYDQAIKSMESLESIDAVLKVTYQKLIYYRGIEFFNNNDLLNAEKQFRKSLAQNSDPRLNALNQYWLGEVAYLRRDYTTAIETWKKFQLTEGASQLNEYDLSNYALGYAYFYRREKDDYTNANISFRKFLLSGNKYDGNKVADAQIRAADCYFMNRDFVQAAEYYSTAIGMNRIDMDYALYQKALCDGLNRNYRAKVDGLKKIESAYPSSNYLVAALNEIADTYYNNLKDQESAIVYYEKILKNYPNSSFANNCYAQLGNIYYERRQDDKAFVYYDKFVKRDSKSEAAKDVLEAIKKIFEAKGNVEEMEAYFASVGNPLNENQLEKATYTAAYDAYYTDKNCAAAEPKWDAYATKFPNGRHITEARFNSAECAYNRNDFDKALQGYLYVIDQGRGIYSEVALSKASYLYYKNKKYAEALPLFQQLQDIAETPANKTAGRLGAMRSAFYLNDFETALGEANKVMASDKLSPQQTSEARYIKAKSLYETKRYDDALLEFRTITKNARNATGAEAFYHIALIQYARQDYKTIIKKTINDLIGYAYSNDEWNNKGMLLLADAYSATGEFSDARIILSTIIENKPRQEFIDQANKKLQEVTEKENAARQPAAPADELKLQFNENAGDSSLFNNSNDEQ